MALADTANNLHLISDKENAIVTGMFALRAFAQAIIGAMKGSLIRPQKV